MNVCLDCVNADKGSSSGVCRARTRHTASPRRVRRKQTFTHPTDAPDVLPARTPPARRLPSDRGCVKLVSHTCLGSSGPATAGRRARAFRTHTPHARARMAGQTSPPRRVAGAHTARAPFAVGGVMPRCSGPPPPALNSAGNGPESYKRTGLRQTARSEFARLRPSSLLATASLPLRPTSDFLQ